jgi:hypothetical protein
MLASDIGVTLVAMLDRLIQVGNGLSDKQSRLRRWLMRCLSMRLSA